MKTNQYKKGFTLVELMITAVASAILILTVALILMMVFQSWRINNAYADLRRDAALAVYMMAKDVREADYGSLTGGTTLTLPSAVPGGETVSYTRNGGKLDYTDGAGTRSIITKNVGTFYSTRRNDGVLLSLKLANDSFKIGITNEVFVNTRN